MSYRDTMPAHPKRATYAHQFVEHMPEQLAEGVLYVSVRYATAAHLCFCGCGREVVTPLHPTKWRLTFDGIAASLHPSVGSWALACKSHYWLQDGRIEWADSFTDNEIKAVQRRDVRDQMKFYGQPPAPPPPPPVETPTPEPVSFVQRMLRWLGGKA